MTVRHTASWIAAAALLAVSSPALAQQQGPRDSPDREWYGWQTAVLGGASGIMFVAGATSGEDAIAQVGGACFMLASPLSHLLRGEGLRALGSLGLNVGVPFAALLTFGVPAALANGSRDDNRAANLSLAIGMAVAAVIDAAALSWRDRPRRRFIASTVEPFVAPSDKQLVLGVSWTA